GARLRLGRERDERQTGGSMSAAAAETLVQTAEAFAGADHTGEPQWLRQLRRDAASAFARLGLPAPRDPAWRHTSTAPLGKIPFRLPRDGDGAAPVVRKGWAPAAGAARLVFVDGRFDAKAST